MDHDKDKIDEDVLALLFLNAFREKKDWPWKTWKSHDWEVLDRLCEKGYISDPKSKAKSVVFTDEGLKMAKQLFEAKYVQRN
ncbi:DUF6429 family protein [Synoicihabitans lomoniglobus]|uniref:DUF6429 family protein n=1 Tax=Synoicihabitans lomoniglobus TaxID=2909285 RepID=A0AAF0CNL5_9BACT|nr:DUF6429 family protein [Opitutaceae bacterium LMO-M01]WED64686.1 DUF6429 family protein [Opitutaceae bacterium LMO-M01]